MYNNYTLLGCSPNSILLLFLAGNACIQIILLMKGCTYIFVSVMVRARRREETREFGTVEFLVHRIAHLPTFYEESII